MPQPVNGVMVFQVTECFGVSRKTGSTVYRQIRGFRPSVVNRHNRRPGLFQALAAESVVLPPELPWEQTP